MRRADLFKMLFLLWAVPIAHPASLVTEEVRHTVPGAGHSLAPSMTPDARCIVFISSANNLSTNDDLRAFSDVFVRDRVAGITRLVSVTASGFGGGNGDSTYASISTNGRYVLFASHASNLLPGDTNGASDVFLRDLELGTTELISCRTNGAFPRFLGLTRTLFGSSKPIMTPDARFVVFESTASDIVPGDNNGLADIFVRDMQTRITRLVSAGAEARGASGVSSHSPAIAADGSRVAFTSSAGNLIFGRQNLKGDIYVRDLIVNATYLISTNIPINCASAWPVISDSGRHVAFKAWRDGVIPTVVPTVFYHDITTGITTALSTNTDRRIYPAISGDGRRVVFDEAGQLYAHDMGSGVRTLVSVRADGQGPASGFSGWPMITRAGQHVAFVSTATNLLQEAGSAETNMWHLYVRDLTAGVTRRVVTATNGLASASDVQNAPAAISSDGQLVAFDSQASDLVANDLNEAFDVFVRDISDSRVELISERHTDRPPRTGVFSSSTSPLSLSADGRLLVFSSRDNLGDVTDTNRQYDVFVRDLSNGSLKRISAVGQGAWHFPALEPRISGNGEAVLYVEDLGSFYQPSPRLRWSLLTDPGSKVVEPVWSTAHKRAMSYDGTLVVFGYLSGLYARDMLATSNAWRSIASAATNPVVSKDKRFVAYVEPQISTTTGPIFIRDLASNTTMLASIDAGGVPLDRPRTEAGMFSLDDNYLFFWGQYTQTNEWRIYRFHMQSGQSELVCTGCQNPSVSSNGQVVGFTTGFPRSTNIYVMDLRSGVRTLITRELSGGESTAVVGKPLLSSDARYVVFQSQSSHFVANDLNRFSDVFVHDRVQGTTLALSRSRFGSRTADRASSLPVMSDDGRTVAFQSFATDLVEGDYNDRSDIFVVKLGSGDSDNDGMDDDWEVAHFGDLNRDGAGDQDGDRQTDLQEFLAGTNPTNGSSILRVLTITPMGGGSTTVVWSAVVGRDYVVQYKDSLDANWTNASGVIEAESTSMSFAHNSSSAQRYYRVIAVR